MARPLGKAIRVALLGALAMGSAAALAQVPGPSIDHKPVTELPAGKPAEIRALITSNSTKKVFNPTLYLRPAGVSNFSRVPLQPVAGIQDLYSVILPSTTTSSDFDYYLEAYDEDGNGPTRVGSEGSPVHVHVLTAGANPPLAPSPDTGAARANLNPPDHSSAATDTGVSQPAPSEVHRTNMWIAFGSSAALLAGAVVVTKVTQTTYEGAKSDYRNGLSNTSNQSNLGWQGPLADALWAGTVVAAGIGVFLYLSTPSPAGSGGEVGLSGHF